MRSAVIAAFIGATLVTGSAGTAAAGVGLPDMPDSGSASSGSAGGLATTGSSGTGSAGLPNLDRLLLGGEKLLCAATGSAAAMAGTAHLGCGMLP
ncbi:hypothetical protein GV791_23500 [Nocardia cyriacigeorgica]|uniref:Uncharacterized protein n=1 Tax=Nocardia cyriacigeorgica TaxID=135487 RepID=A0A6P1CSI8_9NOCA|nr:hypothetical protein [Nocardia cyriacigeorgica]MBF6082806.1 hypothetical protein [Nocardia cyriacigeorgica]MBF6288358.1 hypothetical protein [Nocardia cyriacigeorgica]MBF6427194.1 hypothetical protein [Nocardia cyriacigeorgica]NEW35509.1 hypothetical protein [Nocardia cyriacigeorgica]BDT85647.1 hypothetical protein FMUAM8_14110 [Nocardia cyriacigeorgica]